LMAFGGRDTWSCTWPQWQLTLMVCLLSAMLKQRSESVQQRWTGARSKDGNNPQLCRSWGDRPVRANHGAMIVCAR
jgi:hypothetical protein